MNSPGMAALGLLWAAGVAAQTTEPDGRVVRAEAPIVAGNAVSAKKLAMAAAFRQAVESALEQVLQEGEPVSQPWPPALAQLKASLGNAAQRFVRSYRLIEQATAGGMLTVMVEAEVDTAALRREVDRARGTGAGAKVGKPAGALLVAGSAVATPAVMRALGQIGLVAQLDRAPAESALVADAARTGARALFVGETDSAEGPVLGTAQVAVKCSLALHFFAAGAPGGKPALAQAQEEHGFADDAVTAREDCLDRVAGQLVRVVAAQLRAPPVSAPFVTVELDIVDPGAVEIVLEACRRIGSVVATEPRRIMASAAELRVFSPMTGPALQLALVREIAGRLAVVPIRTAGDTIYLQLRNPAPVLERDQ